ncbi:alpha-2-macroglobulin family protein [Bordetella genomosp. 13]|uniref:Alpha-2-macroglobulin n=1 Tax=Bordetella genomosp. 13 TaxID=463040 RepID=A0A1W6ZF71_9BORD|nr:alpha-2-macroglobulin [Bordetella genomosp. 13]
MSGKRKGAGLALGMVLVVAAAAGLGWWAGRSGSQQTDRQAPPAATQQTPTAQAPIRPPAPVAQPAALPASAVVGQADPFAALSCHEREYGDAPALAVTFTQPVDRRANLDSYLEVIETAPSADRSSQSDDVAQAAADGSDAPGAVQSGDPGAKGKTAQGRWIVGDNPRVAYFPYVQPQRAYTVRLRAGLPAAAEKVTLPAAGYCQVDTQAMPPSYYFASRGVVLPAGQNGGLPVVTVNQPEVDVQFLRVPPERVPEFFGDVLRVGPATAQPQDGDSSDDDGEDAVDWEYSDNRGLKGLVSNWELDRLHALTQSVYQGRFITDATPNRRHVTFLPVEQIAELRQPGIYVAVMSQPGRFRYESQVTYFYVSDMGLMARRYPSRLEGYVVSLKSGQPVSGATVELVDQAGKVLAKAGSDAEGHVRFEGAHSAARLIRAVRGQEMTVLALGEPSLDLSEFDVGGHPSRNNNLFVYAGRNLYRPGETFTVSVLPRDPDGRPLPSAPLTATLKRPDGRVARTALWHPHADAPNYLEQSIDMPVDAQTGTWSLELRVDPASRVADASWWFQVEEFLPERMKLVLTSPEGPVARGESWRVDVQGDYLYGAPAAGNRLLGSVAVRRNRNALPQQWPGFVFGDVDDDGKRQFQTLPETELDDEGKASLDIDDLSQGANSPMLMRLSASLLESGGRPVVRSLERTIWPADKLIAVRPLFDRDVAREGAPAGFELIRVDAQGRDVPLKQAQMRLYREDRRYYWRYDDQRGWNSGYILNDELSDSRTLDIAGRTSLTLAVGWGTYRLEIADPETGQTLRYRFYAGWGAQDAESVGNRPDRVQMKLSAVPAKRGDTVKLTLTPPHDGQALITVEGDRMLWSKWVSASTAGTEVDIPLDPSWKRNDLYVSATVLRPGSQGDRVTPARAVGLAYLPMANDDRKLDVRLSAPAKIKPETRATVRVKVDGAQGGQAMVTLSAVDVGILNINQYATPDPFDFFFGKHRYAPDLLDMYGKLIEKMDGTAGRLKWGGDAAMRGDSRSLPKKVKLVDLYSGPVRLNERGEADIPLDVPDFNGTLRLMAVAFTAERYGSADAQMQVAAPIVAELNTPRFITPGDHAAIALDLTNLSGAPQKITVNLQALDPLAIADGTRTVTLRDKQRTTVRFTATTTGSYGLGMMRLSVNGDGGPEPVRILRESVLQVQPAYSPERSVRRLRLAPGETLAGQADWLRNYFPDSVSVSLTLSNRPPFNVNRLVDGLLNYPYGCTEQTISAALPWVLIDEATAKRFGLKARTQKERQDRIAGALQRLSGMRGATGSYSLWGDTSTRDVWLTAYAVGFMQDARDQGFEVPQASFEGSRNWLLTQVQQASGDFGTWSPNLQRNAAAGRFDSNDAEILRRDHQRFAGLATAALVLARDGKVPLSAVRLLYDNYGERARSPLPLMQLAAAFKLLGDEGRMKSALNDAMTRAYGLGRQGGSYDDWLGDYGSGVRDYALAYAIAMQHGLRDARAETLLDQVAARLGGRSYMSTQEQMALLLAARSTGSGGAWRAALSRGAAGAGEQALSGSTDQTLSVAPAELAGLQLRNTGEQPLYAELDVQGTALQPPAPRGDVIRLARRWYTPDAKLWNGGTLRTGDMLVVRIQADARQLVPDGLIVDRVPAGFEVENLNLSQGENMQDWTIGGRRVAEALADPNIKHREFRDDRYVAAVSLGRGQVDVFYLVRVVTPGRYRVPSTVAEDMYRPEVRGVDTPWSDIHILDRGAPGS